MGCFRCLPIFALFSTSYLFLPFRKQVPTKRDGLGYVLSTRERVLPAHLLSTKFECHPETGWDGKGVKNCDDKQLPHQSVCDSEYGTWIHWDCIYIFYLLLHIIYIYIIYNVFSWNSSCSFHTRGNVLASPASTLVLAFRDALHSLHWVPNSATSVGTP